MQYSVLYYPKQVKHCIITASSEEELVKKLAEVSQREESPDEKFIQLKDGSVIKLEKLDCDSLALDDFSIEPIEN